MAKCGKVWQTSKRKNEASLIRSYKKDIVSMFHFNFCPKKTFRPLNPLPEPKIGRKCVEDDRRKTNWESLHQTLHGFGKPGRSFDLARVSMSKRAGDWRTSFLEFKKIFEMDLKNPSLLPTCNMRCVTVFPVFHFRNHPIASKFSSLPLHSACFHLFPPIPAFRRPP